ncbi:MAG: DUF1275 domain-containing protein [Erysipelotrichaceae bacterium]|nr:DUF1275 domain-containing protein [Erysipelotrichaceae bacterium]
MDKQSGSHSPISAGLLSLTGGMLDAYTYVQRGGVFANAQTGNMVKLGILLAQGKSEGCIAALIPIISFVCGSMLASVLGEVSDAHNLKIRHRGVLILEMITIVIVSFLPHTEAADTVTNILIPFVCAMQSTTFSKFAGQAISMTVFTGNLSKAAGSVCRGILKKDLREMRHGLFYYVVICLFIFGGFVETKMAVYLGNAAVLITLLPLLVTFAYITVIRIQIDSQTV